MMNAACLISPPETKSRFYTTFRPIYLEPYWRGVSQLVIPKKQVDGNKIFIKDSDGMKPVVLENPKQSREEFVRSRPKVVVQDTPEPQKKKRSWQKEALIIGGSSGAGAAIGAISGGVAGLVYDMATRN